MFGNMGESLGISWTGCGALLLVLIVLGIAL